MCMCSDTHRNVAEENGHGDSNAQTHGEDAPSKGSCIELRGKNLIVCEKLLCMSKLSKKNSTEVGKM